MKRAVVAVAALVAALLPALPADAAPKIEFLNPSGYTTPVVISDKTDEDNTVHLVAWVREVPVNPLVEFEFTSATGIPNLTIDGRRAGNDTWEGTLNLSGINDGQYILRARVYANFTGPGTGTEVAATEQNVTVDSSGLPPPAADTIEITYPANAASLGFYKPPGKPANFLIDGIASEGTQQARAFYTTSDPGSVPGWTSCGHGRVGAERRVRVRCTLDEGVSGSQVTAVALVANETPPPATPSAVGDATGDAHRVSPYAQIPQSVELTPTAVPAEVSSCQVFVATALDQAGRPIAAANVDVHAVGPDDQIQFGVIERTSSPQATVFTSPFKAPDKGHPSSRVAWNCGTREPAQERQGDHNIPGANDPQHIESTDGTNNEGSFTFVLRSAATGGTQVEAWIDDDDDDAIQAREASGGARIGWGQPPPPPARSILLEPSSSTATTGSCQRIVLAAKEGGNPLISANVDIHVSGPDESVAFCTPTDASAGREPDQGSHVAGADDAQTRHLEGETDSAGRFVFGVTAAAEGRTTVTVWVDTFDDDVLTSDEPSRLGEVAWTVSGDRDISINASRTRVRRGRPVRIFGTVSGTSAACEEQQLVRLQARRMSGGRFRTIDSSTTESDGDYSFTVIVRKSKRYRTVAPDVGACEKARSRTVTVRRR